MKKDLTWARHAIIALRATPNAERSSILAEDDVPSHDYRAREYSVGSTVGNIKFLCPLKGCNNA